MTDLVLGHGLAFEDLYRREGLERIDALFLDHLATADAALCDRLVAGRADPSKLEAKEESDLLLAVAPRLESFLGDLFGFAAEIKDLAASQDELSPIFSCKKLFVQIKASKAYTPEQAAGFDGPALEAELAGRFGGTFDQLSFATNVNAWLEDKEANAEALDLATRYAAWAVHTEEGRERHKDDNLFKLIRPFDFDGLVHWSTTEANGVTMMVKPDQDEMYLRDGFVCTDPGFDLKRALDQIAYCAICHDRGRDYCRKGMRDKETGKFKKNPLGVTLVGCPLDEKISEMHKAKMSGWPLAALALITVDNPLVAATGHRICNDCMKACIFQKQEPVDIPQVETRILKDALALPWGFEAYSLLTRWNPLSLKRPLPLPDSDFKVLIVGLGPAGFTLAHHLMQEGHSVVAIDGLKIEPLPAEISGVAPSGERVPFKPIRDISKLYESLDNRVMAGFGGVAEYGITVRWDKNFLKVVRLLVERRDRLTMLGGVRFGSAITVESAFEMGFDHIALCAGAGKPTYLEVPNGLARGVRQASDFLMALQLTGAAKMDSIANLQIRMPVVVVGGGLTAMDAATEALGYYVRQVEKFLTRYEVLVSEYGEDQVRSVWNEEETIIADEFLSHARAIREERGKAAKEGRKPRFIDLLNQWGGSTIAYRRSIKASPSYRLNHEEIIKSFEQGVRFAELLAPLEVEVDNFGHAKALRLERQELGEDGKLKPTGKEVVFPARSILVAAGTQPNTTLAREHPGFADMDGKYYQAYDEDGKPASPEWHAKPEKAHMLIKLHEDGRAMSFFGDLHPSYAGNVVGAMTSATQGYPVINRVLARKGPSAVAAKDLVARLNDSLRPVVVNVEPVAKEINQITIRAPICAEVYEPGQFFRLQNYETNATRADGTTLAMEAVALTGAVIGRDEGMVSLICLNMGGSTRMVPRLQPGEPVILMGPTGAATEIPPGGTVLLAGGGVGNAVLMTINLAFRQAGTRILYFAAYKGVHDRFRIDDIMASADVVVWCCDEPPGFQPTRPQDKAFVGNIVQAMQAYGEGRLGEVQIPLDEVDRIIAIGSDIMMNAVAKARHTVLKDFFRSDHIGLASINAPMQCMMKEICAQCLLQQRDPETGKESVVFTCFNQDRPIDVVDFGNLHQRLCQNAVQEKLTRQWIAHCLKSETPPGVRGV